MLLYIAVLAYSGSFVLGNANLSQGHAIVFAGLIWTAIVWALADTCMGLRVKPKGRGNMLAFYFLVNFMAIWLTARLAPFSGFGIVSYTWALGLAFVANIAQWIIWQYLKTIKLV